MGSTIKPDIFSNQRSINQSNQDEDERHGQETKANSVSCEVSWRISVLVNERRNDTTAITKSDLDCNAGASFCGSTNVISIPHHHNWNHWVNSAGSQKCPNVLDSGGVCGEKENITDDCRAAEASEENCSLVHSVTVESTENCKNTSKNVWRNCEQL